MRYVYYVLDNFFEIGSILVLGGLGIIGVWFIYLIIEKILE